MFGVLLTVLVLGIALGSLFRLTLRELSLASIPLVVAVADELAMTLSVAAGLVVVRYWTRQRWRSLVPLSSCKARSYLPLLVSAMGLALLTAALRIAVLPPEPNPVRGEVRASASVLLFSMLVLAPFTEELLMRGAVLGGLLRRYSTRKSVLISALAFAGLHLNPYQVLQSLVLGLISGWVRVQTGSLWPGILAHVAFNAALILIAGERHWAVYASSGAVVITLGLIGIRREMPGAKEVHCVCVRS
ncbi:MAG: type II CAAX endopeptidase family protein [Polyangiaceae bacterium]|nr:type II CAAX endopeptidase family protein [Polyangiaceae bacterium]